MFGSKYINILAIIFLVLVTSDVYAQSGVEVKYNGPNVFGMILEDIITLLPTDMKAQINNNIAKLYESADVNKIDSARSFSIQTINKNQFVKNYSNLPINNSTELVNKLGSSLIEIYKIAYSSKGYDPFNDAIKTNIAKMKAVGYNLTYFIEYDGYNKAKFGDILNYAYKLNTISDYAVKYSAIVKVTTDLWAAAWENSGGRVEVIAKSFTRMPMLLDAPPESAAMRTARAKLPFGMTMDEYVSKNDNGYNATRLRDQYIDTLALQSGRKDIYDARQSKRQLENMQNSLNQIENQNRYIQGQIKGYW